MMQRLRLLVLGIVGFLGVFFAHGSWLNRLLAFVLCGVLSADSGLCMAQVAKFSGQANATTSTLLSQRSREFDDPPNPSPANNPQAPPFPLDAGPNFIRPDFGVNLNLPPQNNVTPPQNSVSSSQSNTTASLAVVEPNRIYRISGFSRDRLKQYTSDILIENGTSYLQSITADVKTGNSAVDGVYQTQFNRGQNFFFRITKNNRDSLTSERLDSNRWRIRFIRNNVEILNSVLERKEQIKRNNKIPVDVRLEELEADNGTVLIAEDICSDSDRTIGGFLNSIDGFAETIINKFNGSAEAVGKLPPNVGGLSEEDGEYISEGSDLVQEGMNKINSGGELDRIKDCAKNEKKPPVITSLTCNGSSRTCRVSGGDYIEIALTYEDENGDAISWGMGQWSGVIAAPDRRRGTIVRKNGPVCCAHGHCSLGAESTINAYVNDMSGLASQQVPVTIIGSANDFPCPRS